MIGRFVMLSHRAGKIKPSQTLAIDAKAKAMKAKGIDIVNFGVGEPDFDTPENIKEVGKALKEGFTKYIAVGGIYQLKDAIIENSGKTIIFIICVMKLLFRVAQNTAFTILHRHCLILAMRS